MDERFVWTPDAATIEHANVTRLMRAHGIGSLEELTERSVADIAWFWDAVVRDLDIGFSTHYGDVVETSRGVEWATWFVGGETNLAGQCVDRWAALTPEATAVVWEGEDGEVREATYAELRRRTDGVATALAGLGVRRGDAVGLFLPMAIETVAAVMACAKLGAVWVPIFSGFGAGRGRRAPRRRGVHGPDHREREPAQRRRGPDEGDGRPRGGRGRRGSPRARVDAAPRRPDRHDPRP